MSAPSHRFDLLTLFPGLFDGFLSESILKRALARGLVTIERHNLRDWAVGKHKPVDDRPFGGGPGMVLMAPPVVAAVEAVRALVDPPGRLIVLTPSGTETTLKVQDVSPMVITDTAQQIHTVDRTRIEQLPLNGRNVFNLLQTVPGITLEGTTGLSPALFGRVHVFGQRQGTHDVLLDGAALTDYLDGGKARGLPGMESIQEFTVVNNASSAKFTRPGTIIYLTKNGTNELHGSLFETNRNSGYGVARARNNLTNIAAPLNRNEYGGSIGGPVWLPKIYDGRNRTFFFFSYEGLKLRTSTNGLYSVPTDAMRNGDFSGLVNSAGTFTTIYDPWSTNSAGQRQPFNYGGKLNHIDPSLISPLAKYFYSILPEPNIPNANPLVTPNYAGLSPDILNTFS